MVPAPCPLHLRPGGGARPALRPGEPPPPRAGPTATRRCGRRQRGRGAAGVAAEEEPALSPARPLARPPRPVPGLRRRRGVLGLPGSRRVPPLRDRLRCHLPSESVRPSTSQSARSLRAEPLPSTRRAPSVEGNRTHALPPAADRLLRSRDPAQPGHAPWPRPTCSVPPLAAPRGAPPLFPARDDAARSDSLS